MKRSVVVGIIVERDGARHVEWHAPPIPGPDYHTMCCVDGDDPGTGTFGSVRAPRGQKITCEYCHRLWRGVMALGLREFDFAVRR